MSKAYDRIAKKTPLATRLEVLEDMAKIDKLEIERLKKELEVVKNLGIANVSNQRELLLAFAGWLYGNLDKEVEQRIVDDYLNSK